MSDIIGITKAVLWEEAKGKLRAMAAAGGMHKSTEHRSPDAQKVADHIEQFIEEAESVGLHE